MRYRRWFLALAVLAAGFTPSLAEAQPPRLTPLVVGWERHFSITWETVRRGTTARVAGYVTNESGFAASRMRLLIDGLDASGQIVGQSIAWIPRPRPGPGARVYFDDPAPAGVTHRVSIFEYDWVQAAELDAP